MIMFIVLQKNLLKKQKMTFCAKNLAVSGCFSRIVKRLEGVEVPFQKNKKKPLLERIFG